MSKDLRYLPEAGTPTILTLSVLLLSTAAHAVFLVQGAGSPLWLTGVTLALLVAVCAAIPSLNRRARAVDRVSRVVTRSALAAAIVVPLVLLCPASAMEATGWLLVVGVAIQAGLLLTVIAWTVWHPGRSS
jgi:hypothetical protein